MFQLQNQHLLCTELNDISGSFAHLLKLPIKAQGGNERASGRGGRKRFQPFERHNWHVTVTGNCAISTTGQCQQALNASCYGNTRERDVSAGKIERMRKNNSGSSSQDGSGLAHRGLVQAASWGH